MQVRDTQPRLSTVIAHDHHVYRTLESLGTAIDPERLPAGHLCDVPWCRVVCDHDANLLFTAKEAVRGCVLVYGVFDLVAQRPEGLLHLGSSGCLCLDVQHRVHIRGRTCNSSDCHQGGRAVRKHGRVHRRVTLH